MSKIRFQILSPETEIRMLGKPLRELPGIGGYFENFTRGRLPTLETQFGNPLDRTGVLNVGLSQIKSWRGRYPRLVDYELGRVKKYGPQGGLPPLSNPEPVTLFGYYYTHCDQPCRVENSAMKVLKAMYQADLQPLTPEETATRMYKKTKLKSNAGLELGFTKRVKVLEQAIAKAKRILSGDFMNPPSAMGARSIRNGFRFIFMADFAWNIAELCYVYPMMDWMQLNFPNVAAWGGQTAVVKAVNDSKVFDMSRVTHMSTDFTKMDTSMGPAQLRLYYELTSRLLKYKSDQEIWKRIVQNDAVLPVIVGTVITPGSAQGARKAAHMVMASGTHGLLSGLGITNHCETVVNGTIPVEMETTHKQTVVAFQSQGDDGMMTLEEKHPGAAASAFARVATRRGLIANAEKQFESPDEIHFLQRVYSPETRRDGIVHGAYPLVLALNSTKNPERIGYGVDPQLREIEIAENCNGHPAFESIVSLYTQLDPEIVAAIEDPDRFAQLSQAHEERMEAGEQSGDFTRSGSLGDFDFVRIVRGERPLPIAEKFAKLKGIDYGIEL